MSSAKSAEKAQKKGLVSLHVSDDKLRVIVGVKDPIEVPFAIADAILSKLDKLEVNHALSQESIFQWIQAEQAADETIMSALLLEGVPSVPTVNGSIEWADDFFATGFKIDPETGSIDFRQKSGRSTVSNGELLATLHMGTIGKSGKDIFGEKIPVSKPQNPKLNPGPNVVREEGDNRFYAAADGRVELAGGRLSVSDVLVISGDIGLESGDINHRGSILVEHDILEDSSVFATGDVEVQGLVEAATIVTEGSLYVQGGICGKPGTSIKVGGDIHAKFILESKVEAGGDIVVQSEIDHSVIHAQGDILVPQGRIIGGEVSARGEIRVGEAGSEACVPTGLTPGIDPQLQERLAVDKEEISSLVERKNKIVESLKPILPGINSMPVDKKESVIKLLEGAKEYGAQAEELEERVTEKEQQFQDTVNPVITVYRTLFPELKVCIKGEHQNFKQAISGPVKIECVGARIKVTALD